LPFRARAVPANSWFRDVPSERETASTIPYLWMTTMIRSALAIVVCALPTISRAQAPTLPAHLAAAKPLIEKRVATELPDLVALYKHIHSHAELSLQEEQTGLRLAKELRAAGFDVTERFGGHGVVGVLKNGPGPTILVRADMDALPIVEETGLPYASNVRTRDADGREIGVMHACGHDANVACLVGTARVLSGLKDRWQGTLLFIGQPAEEIGAGAKTMLDAGLFKKFPRPDYGLALHCDGRYPHGVVNWRSGQMQANVDSVDITVRGKGGHGAAPHVTIDPIVIAARIILDLQTLVSRERNPSEPAVVTVGSIHGGTKHNIIPDDVKLQLTVRTMNDQARKEVLEGIVRIAKAAALAAKAPEPIIRHDPDSYTPALVNDPEMTKRFVKLFQSALGPDRVVERPMSMGGEDFSRFHLAGIKTFYWHLGSVSPERYEEAQKGGKQLPSTHSAFYWPVPEPTIRTGVLTMSLAVLELAGK
jgi:amidohydrolase